MKMKKIKKYLKYLNIFYVSGYDSGYVKGYYKALRINLDRKNEIKTKAMSEFSESFKQTGNFLSSFLGATQQEIITCVCCKKNINTVSYVRRTPYLDTMCSNCYITKVFEYFNDNDCNYITDIVFDNCKKVKLKVVKND